MQYLSADSIYLHNSIISQSNNILVFDNEKLVDIVSRENAPADSITHYEGLLIPGFVNAHCHLELSHLKDIVPRGTKLVPFLINILKHRTADEETILKAATDADIAMYNNGIVAVGDISNRKDSFNIKKTSPLYYHTFIECLGMDPERVEAYMQPMLDLSKEAMSMHLSHSITPHAPYSISENLLKSIYSAPVSKKNISLHFQETLPELELFDKSTGDFFDFYDFLNLKPFVQDRKNKNEIDFILTGYENTEPYMLVHNSYSDVAALQHLKSRLDNQLYLCTCPKANLYIENTLPDYAAWLQALGDNEHICVGTDSLASNDTLDIYSELLTIQSAKPDISSDILLHWATLNGAHALSIEDTYGSFDIGKTPGAVLLPLPENGSLMAGKPVRVL